MNYRKITTDRKFKDATGHNKSSFLKLLSDYEATYIARHGETYETYIAENVTEVPHFKTLGDALFFVLFQLKNDLIMGSLSCVFNMSLSSASNNFNKFLHLLEITLEKKDLT